MKKKRRDPAYLGDIEKAARTISEFMLGVTREQFNKDLLRQSGVLYQLAIIGEAAKHLSKELRSAYPDIPWKLMAGMRDVLVHAYHDMDLETVWKAATLDIPALLEQLRSLPK